MDFALAAVTVLSLMMTMAMAVVTWRLLREERRRSAARIAALTAEIERSRSAPDIEPLTIRPRVERTSAAASGAPAPARRRAPLIDLPIRPALADPAGRVGTSAADLFTAPPSSSGWPRLASAMGGAAMVLTVAILAAILASHSRAADPASGAAAVQRLPVELVALGHERSGSLLSITGTVRNPEASSATDDLSVVALAFDRAGAQVATGRSPLDRASLSPGEASSFTISIPAHDVSRYRISFLTGGTTVPHVDRRAGPVARSEPSFETAGGRP